MGERTEIAWTDATWNPWQGCHKVSEACLNCYMYRDKKRYGQDANTVVRSSVATFIKPLAWAENREKYGHINRVFTCSWSDFFIEEADPWRNEAWDIIRRTPDITYQILTKRPERMVQCLPDDWGLGWDNVWIGITAENQERFNERHPHLFRMFAEVNFISWEPALGPLTLPDYSVLGTEGISQRARMWVIAGCESGPNARETNLDWVRDLRDQCVKQHIPFFLKQLMIDGKLVTTPELDGQRWMQFPEVRR